MKQMARWGTGGISARSLPARSTKRSPAAVTSTSGASEAQARQLADLVIQVLQPLPTQRQDGHDLVGPQQTVVTAVPAAVFEGQPGRRRALRGQQQQQQLTPSRAAQLHPHHVGRSQPEQSHMPQQLPAPTHQQWAQQLQQRPFHLRSRLQALVVLLHDCRSLPQLQAVVCAQLQHMPPSVLAVAMQQLQLLKQKEQQEHQQSRVGHEQRPAERLEQQLSEQLCSALVKQLPAASAQALTAFLSAAAAGKVAMPPGVVQQLATALVHTALRPACQARQQQQQSSSLPHHKKQRPQQEQQQQQEQEQTQRHEVAAAAWVLTKLGVRDSQLWSELDSLAGDQLRHMSAHDCVMLSWALAKQARHHPRLFHGLQQQLSDSLHQLPPAGISCLLWSYAAAGHYHHGHVSSLVRLAAGRMERFDPLSLSILLWACAKLRHFEPRMLSALRVRALASMADFDPRCLSMTAWALASLGVADEPLAAAITAQAAASRWRFSMQGLANVAWALTRMMQHPAVGRGGWAGASSSSNSSSRTDRQQNGSKQRHQQHQHQQLCNLLQQFCEAAVPLLPTSKPQEVCNLLWACATLRVRHPAFLTAAALRLAAVADAASPLDLAQGLWALEVLRHRQRAAQQQLVLAGLNSLHLFGPQALSNWAWALAASGMTVPDGLPAAVARQSEVLLPRLSPQGVATILWSLSRMGFLPQQLLHAATAPILANLSFCNAQDLCNIAMACCKAGHQEEVLLEGLAHAASNAAAATLASYNSHSRDGTGGSHLQPGLLQLTGAEQQLPATGASLGYPPQLAAASHAPERPRASGRVQAAVSAAQRLKQLSPQGVANLVWAFSGLAWHSPLLVQQLQELAVLQLQQGTHQRPEHIAGLLQGFARLGQPVATLLDALLQRPCHRARQQQRQQQHGSRWCHVLAPWPADALALLVWSAAATGAHMTHADCTIAALQLLQQRQAAASLSRRRCCQLHHALLLLATDWQLLAWEHQQCSQPEVLGSDDASDRSGGAAAAWAQQQQKQQHAVLSPAFVALCAEAWRRHKAERQLSAVQEEVLVELAALGLQPLAQHWLSPIPAVAAPAPGAVGQPGSAAAAGSLSHSDREGQSCRLVELLGDSLVVSVGLAAEVLGPGRPPLALELLHAASVSSSRPRRVLGGTLLGQQCLTAAGWQVVSLTCQDWAAAKEQGTHQQLLKHVLGI